MYVGLDKDNGRAEPATPATRGEVEQILRDVANETYTPGDEVVGTTGTTDEVNVEGKTCDCPDGVCLGEVIERASTEAAAFGVTPDNPSFGGFLEEAMRGALGSDAEIKVTGPFTGIAEALAGRDDPFPPAPVDDEDALADAFLSSLFGATALNPQAFAPNPLDALLGGAVLGAPFLGSPTFTAPSADPFSELLDTLSNASAEIEEKVVAAQKRAFIGEITSIVGAITRMAEDAYEA